MIICLTTMCHANDCMLSFTLMLVQWWIMLRFCLLKPELRSLQFSTQHTHTPAREHSRMHACEWASERASRHPPEQICNVTTFASSTLSNKLASIVSFEGNRTTVHNRNSCNNVSNKNEIHFFKNPKILCNFLLGAKINGILSISCVQCVLASNVKSKRYYY